MLVVTVDDVYGKVVLLSKKKDVEEELYAAVNKKIEFSELEVCCANVADMHNCYREIIQHV